MNQQSGHQLGARLTLKERCLLLMVVDLCLINGALIVAVMLWSDLPLSVPALLDNLKWFVTLSMVWLALGAAFDIYDPVRAASATYSTLNTGIAALMTTLGYQAIPWLTPSLGRRAFVLGFVGIATVSVVIWRLIYARLFCQPDFQRRALILGKNVTAQRLASELKNAAGAARANPFRGTGYRGLDFVEELPLWEQDTLDPAQALVHRIRTSGVDEVLIAEDALLSPANHEALLDCRELGIRIIPLALAYERLTARLPVEYAGRDLSLLVSEGDSPIERLYRGAKRISDVILSLVGIVGMGILMPFIALGNALTSPGLLFYRQQRVGQGGRPFAVFKFRTMAPEAESDCGAVWATQDDPRGTPVGKWLRRTRLDEAPQFINVLRGEMSVVGPRPERPQFVGEISCALPIYRVRHAVRPGITGWAQIRYHYGNSVEDARIKLEYDLYYIKHAGFVLDATILLRTIPVMLKFEGN